MGKKQSILEMEHDRQLVNEIVNWRLSRDIPKQERISLER